MEKVFIRVNKSVRRLQSEIDARQTYIEELESRVAKLEGQNQQQAELFLAALAKRDAAIDCLKGGITP